MKATYALSGMIAGAAALAGSASAQVDDMRKGTDSDRALASFAECVVRGERVRAVAILDMEPDLQSTARATYELVHGARTCMSQGEVMRTPILTWRGAIAEALYARTFKAAPVSATVEGDRAPAWLAAPQLAPYAIAECAAEHEPVAADRLIRAKRHSSEEVSAVAALLPTLRACGKGQKVNFDRVMIHGMVAEGLFRARGGAAGTEGKL